MLNPQSMQSSPSHVSRLSTHRAAVLPVACVARRIVRVVCNALARVVRDAGRRAG